MPAAGRPVATTSPPSSPPIPPPGGRFVGRGNPEIAAGIDGIDVAQDSGARVSDEIADIDEHAAIMEQSLIRIVFCKGRTRLW